MTKSVEHQQLSKFEADYCDGMTAQEWVEWAKQLNANAAMQKVNRKWLSRNTNQTVDRKNFSA